jgi:tRNA-specific 2-thiouridylase
MKKVLVLMSGGIDSSVAAALLKRDGFEVIGAFMKLTDLARFDEGEKRAKKIAKILKTPFFVFDLKKEFKKKIVDYFLKEYKAGNTPNPCVVCNKEIKFGLLVEKALTLGADFVATGHYAKVRKSGNSEQIRYSLMRAKDQNKDQSYFLWMLNQEQLKKILFPVGNYTREEVKNFAKKYKLPLLKVKKSVEICFVEKTVNDFLKKYLQEKPGKIVDSQGKILGEHRGLWFYTIGQRKGIGLPSGPFWVLGKDPKRNILIVTKNEKDLLKNELFCKDVNWVLGKKPKLPLEIKAKIRYKTNFAKATVYLAKNKIYKVVFERPQRAITSGQSVVFYKGQEVLGGGIIC